MMKRSRFTEAQIVAILEQAEGGWTGKGGLQGARAYAGLHRRSTAL